MLSINGSVGKYELSLKTPLGELPVYFESPRLNGIHVNLRPMEFNSIDKYIGIEKRKLHQIKFKNDFKDRDAMLSIRWRLSILDVKPSDILDNIHSIKQLYEDSHDFPELNKNNQHVQIIVDAKKDNIVVPIGVITTYNWNRSNGILYWSEYFDETSEALTITVRMKMEARALFLKYLVEVFKIRCIIAKYDDCNGYPVKFLEQLGFMHSRTIPNLKRYDEKWYDVHEAIFQENEINHSMRYVRKILLKVAA